MSVDVITRAELQPVVRVEPTARRLRVLVDEQVVADTTNGLLLFEKDHVPTYYFPREDLRSEFLVPSDTTTFCPRKGTASYFHLQVGERRIDDAIWYYPEPIDSAPDISQHAAFYWDRVDRWLEEDDEVFLHARDPYHRVDVLHSSRHVQIVVGGVVVADTVRPRLLFETSLPTRYYIPQADVRLDLLTPTTSATVCPYKGQARYWTVRAGDAELVDGAWSYATPIPEIPKIENLIAFYDERVDAVIVDGVEQARPVTPWSNTEG